jgi:hypothetical protein
LRAGTRFKPGERGRAMWWGWADHNGHWRRAYTHHWKTHTDHNQYTTYYQRVTTTTSQAYAGGFVMLDQDTGEVLGTYPASQWASFTKGSSAGAGTNLGVVKSKFQAQGLAETTKTDAWSTSVVDSNTWNTGITTTYGRPYSPLTISFGDPMKPDYLAGADQWRKNDQRVPVLASMREFDLDGSGLKMWEWVGPDEGLIVYNETQDPKLNVTGRELFGNSSFGKSWENGFTPLSTLDKDQSGALEGDELKYIWVWRDNNSDAKVQVGELRSSKELGIREVKTSYEKDNEGGLVSNGGVIFESGNSLTFRDWWSMGGMTSKEYVSFIEDVLSTPSVYQWRPEIVGVDLSERESLKDIEGGIFRFIASTGSKESPVGIFGFSIAKGWKGPEAFVEVEEFEDSSGEKLSQFPSDPNSSASNEQGSGSDSPDWVKGTETVPALNFFVQSIAENNFGWEVGMGQGVLVSQMAVVRRGNSDYLYGQTGTMGSDLGPEDKQDDSWMDKEKFDFDYPWVARRVSGPSFDVLFDAFVSKMMLNDRR